MPRSLPVSDLRWDAWRVYFETTALIQARIEAQLKSAAGLTLADYNILLALIESDEGALRLKELAHRVVFSPSRLTYRIGELKRRGLVERIADEKDGRGASAQITEAGRAAFTTAARAHSVDVEQMMLADLTPEEAHTMLRVFGRVRDSLS